MGFANVRDEPFDMPVWVRGEEDAWLTSPFLPQKLAITALGTSASTGAKGLEGDIASFESFAALVAAPDPQRNGKTALINHQMAPAQAGRGSGSYAPGRTPVHQATAKQGANAPP